MTRVRLLSAIGASVLVVISATTNAATINFGINAPTAGTISYEGGAASLIGSGIDVDSIVGLDTPSNSGTPVTCNACILEFTSGANTGDWTLVRVAVLILSVVLVMQVLVVVQRYSRVRLTVPAFLLSGAEHLILRF
jgi:hypothetical protein